MALITKGVTNALIVSIIQITYFQVIEAASQNSNHELLIKRLKAYWICQQRIQESFQIYVENDLIACPIMFDGWICWNTTTAGEISRSPCPFLFSQSPSSQIATKECLPDGTWTLNENDESRNIELCNMSHDEFGDDLLFAEMVAVLNSLPGSPYLNPHIEFSFNQCVQKVLVQRKPSDGRLYCPRTFDGWECWNDTLAGQIAFAPCPQFVPGFSLTMYAHKVCSSDGTWFRHPESNKSWSNYTTCIDHEDLMFRQNINTLYVAGYSISVIVLMVSLIIFCYFRSLHCTRITIHKNLFASFIINNITWIIWYVEVVEKPEVIISNEVPCQVLHILVHYFLVSNYLWMFCEGLYLHTALVFAFVAEEHILKWFYLIGWGIPLGIIIIYASLRGRSNKDTQYCWIEDNNYHWIISGPVCFSMLLNLLFLVNIVRVLVTKLRAINSPDANQTKKAVRATLILIPLLGLHYLLTPFRPGPRSPGETIYETLSAVVTSLQGFCVALLFCFCNGEVSSAVKRKWNLNRLIREQGKKTSYTATSISYLARSPSEYDTTLSQDIQTFSQL